MNWSTTPPTEQGWYWVAFLDDDGSAIVGIALVLDDGTINLAGDEADYDASTFILWQGPLSFPDPPTGYKMPPEIMQHLMN